MKKRMVNIELLRIISMMMVVMLHYLGKGKLLPALTGSMDVNGYVAWGLESLCIVAVNVYMLISGFFLVESGFKSRRVVELLCQVLFYTILVPLALIGLGVLPTSVFSINHILETMLPVQMEHYWFITAYIIMYLLSPILSTAAKNMSREQLRGTIVALLLFFAVSKSVLPFQLVIDNKGYDGLWFVCVFLVAAYMRLYGIPFFTAKENGKRGVLCYVAGSLGIYGIMLLVRLVYLKTGSLDHFIDSTYHYNHILNLLAAVGLFYAFYYIKFDGERFLSKLICRVAPYTLGVYLLHEQLDIRYLWPEWLQATAQCNVVEFVLRSILAVVIVFLTGILIDMVRGTVFQLVKKVFQKKQAKEL